MTSTTKELPAVGSTVTTVQHAELTYTGEVTAHGRPPVPGHPVATFWLQVTHTNGLPIEPGTYSKPVVQHVNDLP